ncbi:MAG: AAA family ATPase [Actinomycetota bacterium]
MSALPTSPLARPAGTPFVGRDGELEDLVDLLEAGPERLPVAFIVGEAGIGKTRLAGELASIAAERGHRVVWGRGWSDAGSPPYWPWTQVIRQLRGHRTGTELSPLVLPGTRASDRAELFDATASVLHHAAERQPLVVVLDDLHLADPPTLALLGFVATHLREAPLLIVAGLRDRELRQRPELAEPLRSLERLSTTIALEGLDVQAVGAILGSRRRARDVQVATGGNPLYVSQVASRDLDRANSLNDLLRERVTRTGDDVVRTLAAAVVLGPAPQPEDLSAVRGISTRTVAQHLATARDAGIMEPGTVRFVHPLMADATLDALGEDERRALHAAAADHLGSSAGAADRAHHLVQAGPARWQEAVEACVAAAEAAFVSHAHEDATTHLEQAEDLARRNSASTALLAELALARAGSVVRGAGRADAEPIYQRAWELALETGDVDLIARAGARHSIQYYFSGDVTRAVAENARRALELLGDGSRALHARLHAVLSAATIVTAPELAIEHADRAVATAREAGDPGALAAALVAEQVADLGPATLNRRLSTAREIVALAERAQEPDLAVHGRFLMMGALLERGAIGELDAQLRRQDALIDEFASPRFARHGLWFRCTRAMLDGDATAVEALAGECWDIGDRLSDPDGILVLGAQLGVARWMQGRIAEMEGAYLEAMRADPEASVWPAVLAWLWATTGRLDESRGALSRVPPAPEIPSGQFTLLTMVTAADAAIAVGDRNRIHELWEALLPHADRVVPVGMGAACWGTVAARLGALALALDHPDEGIGHLEHAISVCARLRARPWLAEAQLDLAAALLDAGNDDPDRIRRLVGEAAGSVDQLDLRMLHERVRSMRARTTGALGGPASVPPPIGPSEPPGGTEVRRPRIAVLGTFEVVALDGSIPRWTSRKARQLLKMLVARRGVPTPKEQLMDGLWPGEDPDALGNRLSVAISTIRRVLDPDRQAPTARFVAVESGSVRLVLRNLDVDTERFIGEATRAISAFRSGHGDARPMIQAACARHGGEALPDEPYADWAQPLRTEVAALRCDLLRHEIEAATADGDHVAVAAACRALLDVDPHDESAHRGLVDALVQLGAHGQAAVARQRYEELMAELGVPLA